jgi:hypothetical protein
LNSQTLWSKQIANGFQKGLDQNGYSKRRIKLHFLPAYAPHLNPIERLRGAMHKHITHNRHYADFNQFTEAIFTFFRKIPPQIWPAFRDAVIDNFRVISQEKYQLFG